MTSKLSKIGGSYLHAFFQHQLEIKMYHFQTKHYGAHKATDAYLGTFAANFDRWMESSQGEFGQIKTKQIKLNFSTLTDSNAKASITKFIKVLDNMDKDFGEHADLMAIRDEMLADANQLKYLLLFK